MKKSSTIFLQIVIVVISIVTLAGLIRFPLTEGRAANLDLFSIYWDPAIAYMYIASVPFFVGLYQAFKLLGYIGQNEVFSLRSAKALKIMKYCAIAVASFIVVGEGLLIFTQGGKDDLAGPVALGIFLILVSVVIATVAAVFEKTIQSAMESNSRTV
jgi:hypothetical protein